MYGPEGYMGAWMYVCMDFWMHGGLDRIFVETGHTAHIRRIKLKNHVTRQTATKDIRRLHGSIYR